MKLENVPKLPAFQKMYFKLTTHLQQMFVISDLQN